MDDQTLELAMVTVRKELDAAAGLAELTEVKNKAFALWTTSRREGFSKEVRQKVAVLGIRAGRKFGLELRAAQARGEVRSESNKKLDIPSPFMFASKNELHGSGSFRGCGIWSMTDVSDQIFEEALAEAWAENNLGLRVVSRKCQQRKHLTATKVRKTAGARKLMDNLTITLENLAIVLNDTHPDEVDLDNHREDIVAIQDAMAIIDTFLKKVKEQDR